MDRWTLSRIDEGLGSSEVAALRFLCLGVVNKKRLEGVVDAKGLFNRLQEKGLLDNPMFLAELLHTIRRVDLLGLLEIDSRPLEETDANPILSSYRVMLYKLYENMTEENFDKMKFLMSDKLGRRQTELCKSPLDLFTEMEKNAFLSNSNLDMLYETLVVLDQGLVSIVNRYRQETGQIAQIVPPGSGVQSNSAGQNLCQDAEPTQKTSSFLDPKEYYSLTHNPRGVCVVFNNEEFPGTDLSFRAGTQQDVEQLTKVFTLLGFEMVVHKNLTAQAMLNELNKLSSRNFLQDDALVVCVLSHGDMGSIYGTDRQQVSLRKLTEPFTSGSAPTLAGKPKMFFIQACQGTSYQIGHVPCPPGPHQEEKVKEELEEDAGPVKSETVPNDADFLLGMATVSNCKSFRNSMKGSIYIQELCSQLMISAQSPEADDILSVLTRVNREVSQGIFKGYKQMPEPKYTFTKKLVLKPLNS